MRCAEVLPVSRSRRAPDILKSPVCRVPILAVQRPQPSLHRMGEGIEKQRGWKMRTAVPGKTGLSCSLGYRSWGIAYWSYECGQVLSMTHAISAYQCPGFLQAACDCFRRYPPRWRPRRFLAKMLKDANSSILRLRVRVKQHPGSGALRMFETWLRLACPR